MIGIARLALDIVKSLLALVELSSKVEYARTADHSIHF